MSRINHTNLSRRFDTVKVPGTPEKNPTLDEADAYAEHVRVPLLSRIYLEFAHPRRLLVHPYRAVSPADLKVL